MAELVHTRAIEASIRSTTSVLDTKLDNNNEPETEKLLKKSSARNTDRREQVRQFLVMVSCFVSHSITLGVNNALGVIYVELIREFSALRSEAALVQSMYFGIMLLGGVLFTKFIHKFGPGVCNVTGSIVLCFSFLVGTFSVNIYMVIVFAGLLAGVGASMTFLSDFASIHLAFKTKKRTALAVLTLSTTLGQFSFPYIAEILLEKYYWNGTFLVISGLFLQIIPFGLLIHCSEPTFRNRKFVFDHSEKDVRYFDILRDPVVILITAIMLTVDIGLLTQQFFVVDLAELRGFERIVGAMFLSIIGIASLVGRVFGLILLCVFVSTGASVHYAYGLILFGFAHFITGYFKDYWPMLAGIVLEGFSSGLLISNFPAVMIEQCGTDRFLKVLALGNVVSGITDTAEGFVGGKIADQTGGYEFMYYIAAGCVECGALLMLTMLLYKLKKRYNKCGRYKELVKDVR